MAATLRLSLREYWRDLHRGRPGHRFQDRYEKSRRKERSSGAGLRILLIIGAVLALAIGVILSVIPGPAIPFFFIGGGLLATESRFIARVMDWCEVRFRKILAWMKRVWRRLPTIGRVVVVLLLVCSSAATAYVSYKLFDR